ncbi:MAG: hypothetical protein HY834_14925 [Devosia nanyangense]|uniref:Uncharacterized protein n=1 Tax=Devosia nanyangense TaxID=1228055 RepID=A0A933L650_9HYPH|nr:hypothetical protein [Devosia nanyangense]
MEAKATGNTYRGEALRIAIEASRGPQPAGAPPVAPEVRHPSRRPAPIAINDNLGPSRAAAPGRTVRSGRRIGRTIAWAVLLPFYVAVAAGSLGVVALFVKDLLRL